jgi:hypothetical protein
MLVAIDVLYESTTMDIIIIIIIGQSPSSDKVPSGW